MKIVLKDFKKSHNTKQIFSSTKISTGNQVLPFPLPQEKDSMLSNVFNSLQSHKCVTNISECLCSVVDQFALCTWETVSVC